MADTIAGGVGAIVSIYVGLPLDTIKVRVQTRPELFRNPLDCAIQTIRKEGIFALWKGAVPALTSGFIENTVVFTANGFLYSLFVDKHEIPTFRKQCFLNGASAIFSGFCITPAECIKCRLQSHLGFDRESHVFAAVSDLWKQEGIRGFFRGLPAVWGRDIPFYVTFFGSYTYYKNTIRKQFYHNDPQAQLNAIHYVLGGGFAGSLGWFVVFPMDVVKSLQQTQEIPQSPWKTAYSLYNRRGIKAFYKGCAPCVIRGFPANGALFLTVEWTKKLLHYFGMDSGNSLGTSGASDSIHTRNERED